MKKKYLIITITGETNYGNRLQNYALDFVLRRMGAKVWTLSRSYLYRYSDWTVKEKIFLIYDFFRLGKAYRDFKRIRMFRKFDCRYIKRDILKKKRNNIKASYTKVICGSDQVWNLSFFAKQKELFFSQIVPLEKRIAFSASIGTEYIPEKQVSFFKSAIQEYAYVSVREERGAEIIKELTGRSVPVTVDPTLLLSQEEWSEIAKKPKWIKNEKYILTYFLGEISSELNNYIHCIHQCQGLKIINLYAEYTLTYDKSFFAGPDEFVWLVANCEVFITDSFHGCVFATIFKKSFRWFSREKKGLVNMNSRMETLFSKLQLGDWCIGDINEPIDQIFNKDYSDIEEKVELEKKFALKYLQGALIE